MKADFNKGDMILFSSGDYSEYGPDVIASVKKSFNIHLLSKKWESECVSDSFYKDEVMMLDDEGWPIGKKIVEKKCDYFKEVRTTLHDWLLDNGYVEILNFTEIHQSEKWDRP